MKKTGFVILSLFVAATVFAVPLSGMEISGTVWTVPAKKEDKASGKVALKPATGVVVKAVSLEGVSLAEGKTDDKGVYKLNIPEAREKDNIVLTAEVPGGDIRTLPFGKTSDINPITEALTWRILSSGVPPSNFTSNEFNFILGELHDAAKKANVDFSDFQMAMAASYYLVDLPEFNMTLGALTSTYGMPGDNLAAVKEVETAIGAFLQAFVDNDANAIKAGLAENPRVSYSNETITTAEELIEQLAQTHRMSEKLQFEVRYADIQIKDDIADVATLEHVKLEAAGEQGQNVDETWMSRNSLALINGKWILVSRDNPAKCIVEKTNITTDGRLNDWVGIKPCYYRKPGEASNDSIISLFFARDDDYLYWRIDLNMELRTPLAKEKTRMGIPRGEYYIRFYLDEEDANCNNFIAYVINELTSAASGARICHKDQDGKEKTTYVSYDRFAVGSRSIEGSAPLADIFFLKDGTLSFSEVKRKTMTGGSESPFFYSGRVNLHFK